MRHEHVTNGLIPRYDHLYDDGTRAQQPRKPDLDAAPVDDMGFPTKFRNIATDLGKRPLEWKV